MIPKREKDTNIATEVAQGKMLRQRVVKCAGEAADRFMNGDNLNDVIAEIAGRENFNQLQIQRLIEESNTIAYNKKYDTLKKDRDRRISFELAELSKVVERMGATAPPAITNPNWVSGKPGDGEMKKEASSRIESSPIHNPNANIADKREKMLEKRASFDKVEKSKALQRAEKDVQSSIFKIANSLVMTERLHKRANETFNTMLNDIDLDSELISGIQKKAGEIAQTLLDRHHVRPNFVISLEVNPTEKVASLVLGEHSLIKTAQDLNTVAPPKVAPTADIASYQQLVDLARKLQEQQAAAIATPN